MFEPILKTCHMAVTREFGQRVSAFGKMAKEFSDEYTHITGVDARGSYRSLVAREMVNAPDDGTLEADTELLARLMLVILPHHRNAMGRVDELLPFLRVSLVETIEMVRAARNMITKGYHV